MRHISADEASNVLSPVIPVFIECVRAAFDASSKARLIGVHASTRAGIMSSAFEDEVRTRFAARPDVKLIARDRRFLIGFREVLVRFKKVNSEYRTQNYRTRASQTFDLQQPMEGMPPFPRVTLGYRLNGLATALTDIALIFSLGKKVIWVRSLSGTAQVQQLPLVPVTAARKKRVKVRKTQTNSKGG